MRTAYKVRPDPERAAILSRTFGCVRVVWNRTLASRHARYQAEGKSTSYRESDAALTAMKKLPDLAWLNEVSSVPLQQALRHQHKAFEAFFQKRARYPRFKCRRGKQSATYTRAAFRWRDGQLTLAKTSAPLRCVWSWPDIDPAALDPTTVTVSCDPDGRWFVVLHADVAGSGPLPATGRTVGVDLGLKDFAVLSTGERIPHPKHMERHEQRLKRYQRRLARCQQGSANRAKARGKVARQHARVADARRDFLHKASTDLVRRSTASPSRTSPSATWSATGRWPRRSAAPGGPSSGRSWPTKRNGTDASWPSWTAGTRPARRAPRAGICSRAFPWAPVRGCARGAASCISGT